MNLPLTLTIFWNEVRAATGSQGAVFAVNLRPMENASPQKIVGPKR
jgi:hypothetical protein